VFSFGLNSSIIFSIWYPSTHKSHFLAGVVDGQEGSDVRLRPVGAGRPDVAPCLFDACGGENVKGKNVLKSLV
jgi:hypothetical protein